MQNKSFTSSREQQGGYSCFDNGKCASMIHTNVCPKSFAIFNQCIVNLNSASLFDEIRSITNVNIELTMKCLTSGRCNERDV